MKYLVFHLIFVATLSYLGVLVVDHYYSEKISKLQSIIEKNKEMKIRKGIF